nr:MAG TPA: hypothetical protein [Caudoviricetes sp.]
MVSIEINLILATLYKIKYNLPKCQSSKTLIK